MQDDEIKFTRFLSKKDSERRKIKIELHWPKKFSILWPFFVVWRERVEFISERLIAKITLFSKSPRGIVESVGVGAPDIKAVARYGAGSGKKKG